MMCKIGLTLRAPSAVGSHSIGLANWNILSPPSFWTIFGYVTLVGRHAIYSKDSS
jgi:hypothetical protein